MGLIYILKRLEDIIFHRCELILGSMPSSYRGLITYGYSHKEYKHFSSKITMNTEKIRLMKSGN